MPLYLIDGASWGLHHQVVRAPDERTAREMTFTVDDPPGRFGGRTYEVTLLEPDGPPAVLWEYELSPDSPRDCD